MNDTVTLPALLVDLLETRRKAVHLKLSLNAEECAELATLNGLDAVQSFSLKARASSPNKNTLQVVGKIQADLRYICGVSLNSFPASLEIPVDHIFGRSGAQPKEVDLDPLEDGDIEPLVDDAADVADLAYQLFTLALDPYPRHPDLPEAIAETETDELDEEVKAASPFAVLKDLKPRQ